MAGLMCEANGDQRNLRVAFVIDSLGTGGAEASTVALLPLLLARGIDPTVVVLRQTRDSYAQAVTAASIPLFVLAGRTRLAQAWNLRSLVRSERIDLVHTSLFAADQVGRLASPGTQVPVVSSLVSMPRDPREDLPGQPPPWKVRIVNTVDRISGRLWVTQYHAVSEGVATATSKAYGIPLRQISVVERGRPSPELELLSAEGRRAARDRIGLEAKGPVLVAIGRQEWVKGHVDLVNAFAIVKEPFPSSLLLLVGRAGSASEAVLSAVRHQHLGDSVRFLGHRDDVPQLLAASDVMVLPSRIEGNAGVAIEALAAGTPIVASELAGMRGVLRHEENALLSPPGDPQKLAAAIIRVLGDESLRSRLADAGRHDFVERFTLERAADRMAQLYRSVLATSRVRGERVGERWCTQRL